MVAQKIRVKAAALIATLALAPACGRPEPAATSAPATATQAPAAAPASALSAIISGTPSLDAGVTAYERGDYIAALECFRHWASQGNRDAQHYLGVMYAKGEGVSKVSV